MNRFNAITENQKTEELKKVLNSAFFKLKTRQRDLLQYLVNQALAGKEIGEAFIAENFYKIENFFSDENATVRQGVSELRKNLENYYSGEGKSDAVRILFPRGYTPEFVPAPLNPLSRWKALADRGGLHRRDRSSRRSPAARLQPPLRQFHLHHRPASRAIGE